MNLLSKRKRISIIIAFVFVTVMSFSNTNASAEFDKFDFEVGFYKDKLPKESTLVIDKAKNIAKTNRRQLSTGICKEYVDGVYFKGGNQEYFHVYQDFFYQDLKYSGEPFIYSCPADDSIVKVFIANTNENIKGKTMHVAALKLNVYKSTNAKSKKVTSVKQYKTVKVKSLKGSWARIKVNGKIGWVARKYLVNEVTVAKVKKVVTKYKVENWESEQIPVGKTIQEAKGKNGLKYVYYKTKYKNGKLVSKKKKIWTAVVRYTQNEINVTGVESDLNH